MPFAINTYGELIGSIVLWTQIGLLEVGKKSKI